MPKKRAVTKQTRTRATKHRILPSARRCTYTGLSSPIYGDRIYVQLYPAHYDRTQQLYDAHIESP